MTPTLLAILAANQSFDAALQTTPGVAGIVARFRAQIIGQADAERRKKAIAALAAALVSYYRDTVQPAAGKIATTNALAILSNLPRADKPTSAATRKQVLFEMKMRASDRVKIVRSIIDDKTNTLSNRVESYLLEPGRNISTKLEQLRELDAKGVAAQAKYSEELTQIYKGEIEQRPTRPRLDMTGKLTQDVQDGIRQQARRAGSEAETAAFIDKGYEQLAWITVNSSQACPDCRKRQGVVGDTQFWDQLGRPGSGATVCQQNCYCLLVPAETLSGDPSLSAGINSKIKGVLTTEVGAMLLDEHRPGL